MSDKFQCLPEGHTRDFDTDLRDTDWSRWSACHDKAINQLAREWADHAP